MYTERYGTDWETLEDFDEIVERAYALGVANALDSAPDGELDRLMTQLTQSVDRSFVVLAYREGQDAVATETDCNDDGKPTHTWERLVVDGEAYGSERLSEQETRHKHLPQGAVGAALERLDIDSRPADSTERVKRPSFLERDGSVGRQRYQSQRDGDGDTSTDP